MKQRKSQAEIGFNNVIRHYVTSFIHISSDSKGLIPRYFKSKLDCQTLDTYNRFYTICKTVILFRKLKTKEV